MERNDSLRTVNLIALILAIVGAVNWLLVGLFGLDLVATLFANGYGTLSTLSRIVYTIVGLAGVWLLFSLVPALSTSRRTAYAPGPA
jgi:uncharacterized membrane protein YuzA (DUF378 family)